MFEKGKLEKFTENSLMGDELIEVLKISYIFIQKYLRTSGSDTRILINQYIGMTRALTRGNITQKMMSKKTHI